MSTSDREEMRDAMGRLLDEELMARARARAVERSAAGEGGDDVRPGPDAAPAGLERRLDADVLKIAAKALRIPEDQLDPSENLVHYGIDSIAITEVMAQISRAFKISVSPATFFEAKNLADLGRILRARHGAAIAAYYDAQDAAKAPAKVPEAAPVAEAPLPATTARPADVAAWLARHRAARVPTPPSASSPRPSRAADEGGPAPIAVIAMDGMFAKSPDVEAFEAHLRNGDDCIEEIPPERWDWRAVDGDPRKGPFSNVKYGGFVSGHDGFDAAFFSISPKEAELMDPQHRLFMECVWKLIESAGYAPGGLAGRKVGLFLGINLQDYAVMVNRAGIMEAVQLTGLGHSFCVNRISFMLDVQGPSEVVDTACSSSLVAVHRAVVAIRHEGCEMAIAGGSNLMLSPLQHVMYSKVGMISPEGRCKTFSRHANGFARGEGVGAVLLKRLDLAERDGDHILGVIRGSVENHGGGATSLTAPNPQSQARLIVEAQRQANVDPRSISLIECHGTGTPLGDPVEIEGLKAAFAERYRELGLDAPKVPHCGLGSVKSNIGHTETAAGIAGLIKVLLAMRQGRLYRTLHCDEVNPLIDLAGSPFYLLGEGRPWDRPRIDGVEVPRRAGISSFGAGGVNAHVIVEEYVPASAPASARPAPASDGPFIVPLSAKSETALRRMAERLRTHLACPVEIADLAYSLQVGRDAMRVRAAFVVVDLAGLVRQLDAFVSGAADAPAIGVVKAGRRDAVERIDPTADGLDAHEIAARWLAGAEVDWSRAYAGVRRRRLPLPTYPFEHRRFWLPEGEAAAPAVAASATPRQGALVVRQIAADRFAVDLRGSEFFLDDHRVDGEPVLPGVAYLELARAVAEKAGLGRIRIRQAVWLKPIRVTAPQTVELVLARDGAGSPRLEAGTVAADRSRSLHMQARLEAWPDAPAAEPAADLPTLEAGHPNRFTADHVYRAFDAMGIAYGPAHRAIRSLAIGRDASGNPRILAALRLPETVAATADGFGLHPSLMDGAFQAAIGVTMDDKGAATEQAALPFSLETLEILGPCAPEMWAVVRWSDGGDQTARVRTLDLDLLDAGGAVRIRMRGLATRVYGAAATHETLLFEPEWRPVGVDAGAVSPAYFGMRRALLCDAGLPAPAAIEAELEGWTCQALTAEPGLDLAARFQGHARWLLGELQEIVRGRPAAPVLLQVVVGETADAAALSGLSGMLRSARREHPWLWGQLITVAPGLDAPALAGLLAEDARSPHWPSIRHGAGPGAITTLRQSGRLGDGTEAPMPWRDDGVYLITGGGGGLGRQLAREILHQTRGATVVLVGRSPADAGLESWLATVGRDSGGAVRYDSVDVTDADAVAGLVADIRRRHGRLDGVIHAAGIIRDEYLGGKSSAQLDQVMAPKVAGAVHLDQAIGDAPLDFFVQCGSLSGVLGNPGQVDYAAANAFLDGFAAMREARRAAGRCNGRTVSIDWPLLRDGGMGLDAPSIELMTRTTGLVPLASDDAMAALYRALASGAPQMLVAAGHPQRIRDWMTSAEKPPVVETASSEAPPVVDAGDLEARVLDALTRSVCSQLKVSAADVAPDIELSEYGFDSITFTQFANEINERFDLAITPTLFFEYPTLGELAAHLAAAHSQAFASTLGVSTAASAPTVAVEVAEPSPAAPTQPERAAEPAPSAAPASAVAIIGMSGVFPGADDVDALWRNLLDGRDSIREIPADRWDWRAYWGDPASEPGRTNVKWGGFIDGMAEFDAAFFGISPPEARMMDPQQRLLLTQAWRVIEDAGYAPRSLSGSNTGVFIGTADAGYGRLIAESGATSEGFSGTGLAPSLGPNRISFHFNFHGPSIAVETACSSALVAIHRAVESIAGGGCDTALAGGINALFLPDTFIGFSKAGMLSPDGRCKSFSAKANGYVRGEGAGLLFLKRLADAERDGDRILAVIRATGENHGGRASSLTAPNPKAQAALLRAVHSRTGFDPRSVSYIEAHGTGTPLGDPIEIEALTAAFADLDREAESVYGAAEPTRCGIGSVKSNIGHLELAAGIAGVIKTVLQMRHGVLIRTLHCDEANPYLKLDGSRFHLQRENQPWARPRDRQGRELPRRAGVSSFGFGGANAHVVIEEYREAERPDDSYRSASGPAMIVLSAKTEAQLTEQARRLRDFVAEGHDEAFLRDLAFTLQVCRDAMEYRLAFLALSLAELRARLDDFTEGRENPAVHVARLKPNRETIAILERDEEMKRSLMGLAARGKADNLLQLWVRGLGVDWNALHGDETPRKVALPGYPFARTTYWVTPRPAEAAAAPARPAEPTVQETAPPVTKTPAVPASSEAAADGDAESRALAALVEVAARVLEIDPSVLETDVELGEFGFDSITMTGFASKVNDELGLSLTPADFFEFATLARLAHHIAGDLKPSPAAPAAPAVTVPPPAPPPSAAIPKLAAAPSAGGDDPVAIVGVSCQFPMAADAEAFWRNLSDKKDCISQIPADRWDWHALDGDPKIETNKTNIHWAGFIDGVFAFDPLFFGISPREAKLMDPQQRLIITHVWKAIEDAGHAPRSLAGRSVGLFVGTAPSGYREITGDDTGAEGYVATGAVPSVGPNRVSFLMDWHGPSEPIETACSSSLVAIHRAIQAIRAGDCDMAVAGGVNTIVTPEAHINFAKAGMLALDGRCKTFSEKANGYVRGEGAGMLVLKRLSEAERDGDPIYAVIRGSAINHGGRANSLTAPNTAAQAELLKRAYGQAGIDPRTVGYIEAHGTGTALGDPVEVNALKSAFRDLFADAPAATYENVRCGLGSVKTNIGHLELAAGVAGVIKVLMQMRHRTLAASLHSDPPNPYIDFSGSPFFVVRDAEPWLPVRDADGAELPRRAGVSSFGFGGVNAHVILEEYIGAERPDRPTPGGNPFVIPLSAREAPRLRDQATQLLNALAPGRFDDADLPDIAYTLQIGREAMKHRLALVATTIGDLREGLAAYLDGDASAVYAGRVDAKPSQAPDRLEGDVAPEEAARHWARGGDVDWRRMHDGQRRRLRLPTYPFGRDEYHIGRASAGAGDALSALPASVVREQPVATLPAGDTVSVALDPEAFYLRDHRIKGARVLPGAMGLELVAAGCPRSRALGRFVPVSLRQVVWLRPLVVDAPTTARITYAPEEDGTAFRLMPAASGTTDGEAVFVQGKVGEVGDSPLPMDLRAIRARCGTPLSTDWLYATFHEIGIDYGPSFRAVAELFVGEREILAHLRLPPVARDEAGGVRLHPCMLDGAFQAMLGFFHAEGATGAGVPFALDRLDALAPTGADMWAHVRLRPASGTVWKLDIDLADAEGGVCVRIQGFSVRMLGDRIAPAATVRPDAVAETGALRAAAQTYLGQLLARDLDVPFAKIEAAAALEDYGIESMSIVRLTEKLERLFGPLPTTLFFECQTLDALIDYFLETHGARLAELAGVGDGKSRGPEPTLSPDDRPAETAGKIPAAPQPVAIIGLAGRYPGARTVDEFWRNLAAGRDGITEIPAERWDHDRFYDATRGKPGKTNSKWGGFVDDFDCFDPLFFNISPSEAEYMDPQERLFLQCAWEAQEDAGYTRATLAPGKPPLPGGNVGVFVGVMYHEYQLYGAERTQAGQPLALNGSPASIANRVSYVFDFHGPSLTLDSMCSSSLTAIHLACESIRAGSCDVAIAGGVNLTLHPNKYLGLAQGRFTSSIGRCESFGQGGDGYVPGEGVGAVLLKPLDRAIADGDRIYGVIRGTAVNHGGKTNGYTVPNPYAQAAVIERALARAKVDPRAISYIEAHGTGTKLGDPIEISALTRAFRRSTPDVGFCAIGSVKSNIGHCESAAGIAGLTKVLLQLKHGQIAPSLHAETLNPGIDFANSPFVVQQRLGEWHRPRRRAEDGTRTVELPRIAGLSSFGAGGSNAHLIIEEFIPAPPVAAADALPAIFVWSARDDERLTELLRRFAAALPEVEDAALPSVAHVLQEGRESFEARLAIVAEDRDSLVAALERVLAGEAPVDHVHRSGQGGATPSPLDHLYESRDLDGSAAAWAGGAKVDWRRLRCDRPAPPKISLPTYPFARERYWVPGSPLWSAQAPERKAAPTPTVRPLMFAPHWQAKAAAPGQGPEDRVVVVLCDLSRQAAEALAPRLGSVECLTMAPGDEAIEARFVGYATGLLECFQRLFRERPASALVQVVVPIGGAGLLLEGLGGLLRSAHYERQSVRCQLIAVDDPSGDLAERLIADRASGDSDIRYVGGRRLVRAWREVEPDDGGDRRPPYKDGGVYLITGGAGGLGLLMCREIAARASKPVLWLAGRSAPSDDIRRRLDALPVVPSYRQVDVARAEAVADLVDEIRRRHGRLDGIIHGAGVIRDRLLVSKTAEELQAVLAPKVRGLVNLDAASAECDLDFIALFSSASGALGNAGQADYAAANAFMDAFAALRNERVGRGERQGRTVAIDWPYWRDGGMTLGDDVIKATERGFGVKPLETDTAMVALREALTRPTIPQILVLDGDRDRLRAALLPVEAARRPAEPPPAAAPDDSGLKDRVVAYLSERIAAILKVPAARLKPDETLDRYGLDSVLALQIVDALADELGEIPPTLLLEQPKIALLAAALIETHAPALRARLAADGTREPAALPERATAPTVVEATPQAAGTRPQDIAVIAVAGRYPGADTPEAFWELLREGRDCITEVPAERWDHAAIFSPDKGRPGTSYCRWGGFLSDVDKFDAGFFEVSPRDAALMDPQERLFLETVWHLLERAAHTRHRLREDYDARVGVFVGAMYQQYHAFEAEAERKALVSLSSHASIANRVSFFLDLQGPSVAVDTMCSSGLQAVHFACQSLQRGECRLAIAGGVNLSLHPFKYLGLSRSGMLGSRADSRSFAEGDGYLPAEGVGAVLLKPLADARRDGDRVLAVVKGSAINHVGHSAGFGVPSGEAQARLIGENLRACGVDARTVSYVEAAANGSALGDAIEFRALARAFRGFTEDSGFCAIGSVKSNMGHAEAASGMAQLTKVLLQLEHRQLAPSIELGPRNAAVDFAGTPFVLQDRLADWARPVIDGMEYPRRAAISSFGAGGSNVHLILEEGPERDEAAAADEAPRTRRFVFTAQTDERLREWLGRMADFLHGQPDLSMARLAHVLRHGRELMARRLEIVAGDREDLLARLAEAVKAPSFDDPVEIQAGAVDDEDDAPATVPPLVLPGYPFARQRHWITDAQPAVGTPVAASVVGPETAAALIARVLQDELGLASEGIDPAATFRAHGADSMFALRLIHVLAEALGVEVTHRDLESHPTPRALAAFLAERGATADGPRLETEAAADGWPSPLSEGQKGLWVLQKLYPETSAYNVPLGFEVTGTDVEALRKTCVWALERFPILATRIDDSGPEPLMIGCPAGDPLALLAIPEGEDALSFARARSRRPFDLGAAPPVRFELLRHEGKPGDGVFLVTVHHIVFDGVSAVVFIQTFWEAYGCFATGATPPATAPQTDYPAFVAWEQGLLDSARGAAQRAYWQQQLAGDPPFVHLPADRPATAHQAIVGRSLETVLPPDLVAAARAASAALGINPSALFLGALNILLYRYTGEEDLVVGVPTMGRPERRFERTVGYFANMMALRTRLSGTTEAAALLGQVQEQLTRGLDNADYPFVALAREMRRAPHDQPLHAVSYAYQNFLGGGAPLAAGGAKVGHLPALRQEGDVGFGLELFEEGEAVRLVAVYDGARFDAATIERMVGHFTRLVASICTRPEATVASLAMIEADDRARILEAWSQGGAAPRTGGFVLDMILERTAKTPGAVAVVCGEESLTYRQLTERGNRLAAHLRALGIGAGVPVAVLLKRGPDSIVALLAVLAAGGTWVPLDAGHPGARLAAILAEVGAGAIITDSTLEGRLAGLGHAVPVVVQLDRDRKAIGRRSPRVLTAAVTPESAAYIIHTSGSTGRPKGVAVPHRAIAEHCRTVIKTYGLRHKDAVLQFAAHSVDTALEQILPTLACGARLVLRGEALWSVDDCAGELLGQGVTVADLPPAYLRELLLGWTVERQKAIAKALRLVIVGGEEIPVETVRLWRASPLASARLLNAYGPTEATITCLVHEIGAEAPTAAVPIGRPLPGVEAYILDKDGNPVPEGVPGELHIGGRLAIGYHGQPALTESRFIAHPFATNGDGGRLYRTGDLACFVPGGEGLIGFRGRLDDQVKIRGFRVELEEIERALCQFGCRHAAVVAQEPTPGESVLVAFVVPGDDGAFDEAAARSFLAARLPDHMVPSAFSQIDALPLLVSGKIDRGALARLDISPKPRSKGQGAVAPRDAVEMRLVRLWVEVLGLEDEGPLGVFDDFFASGGHSLLALRLLGAVRREFGRTLTIAQLIEAPTIAAQAALLDADGAAVSPSSGAVVAGARGPLVLLRKGDGIRPLFCVHPVGGGVACYAELARRLKTDRAIYGIQAPGVDADGDFWPADDLVSLAAGHVAAVRAAQPSGPYTLVGWSLGGLIAVEMAHQLRVAGEEVEFVGLIESYTPALLAEVDGRQPAGGNGAAEARLVRAYACNLLGLSAGARDLPDGGSGLHTIQDLLAMPELAKALPGMDEGHLRRLYAVFKSISQAAERYEVAPCQAKIVLFAAEGIPVSDITRGWRPFAAGGITAHALPGDHYSILQAPQVGKLAALLSVELSSPPAAGRRSGRTGRSPSHGIATPS